MKSNGINWCWKRLSHAMSLLIFTKSPLDVFCLWIFHHFVRLFSNSFLPQLSSFGMPPVLMRERERESKRRRKKNKEKRKRRPIWDPAKFTVTKWNIVSKYQPYIIFIKYPHSCFLGSFPPWLWNWKYA